MPFPSPHSFHAQRPIFSGQVCFHNLGFVHARHCLGQRAQPSKVGTTKYPTSKERECVCVCVYACARERSRANDCCTRACLVHFLSSFIPHACLLRACRAATCRALVPTGCGLPSTQNPARAQHTRACSTSASRTTATLRSRPKKQATAPLRPVWMLLLTPHDPNICSHTIARTHTHTQTHTHAHTHTHTCERVRQPFPSVFVF